MRVSLPTRVVPRSWTLGSMTGIGAHLDVTVDHARLADKES